MIRLAATTMLAAALLASGAWAQQIGAVGAVNPATLGAPPETSPRQLRITDNVVSNERITAGVDGLAQIMLLDQTTLTIGPNSDVVLDTFVYDPASDTGRMALSLTRGALRFIGGRTTKSSAATLVAPGGLVSVRGALTTIDTNEERTRIVLFAGDSATIQAGGETLVLSRPGAVGIIDDLKSGKPRLRYQGVISPSEVLEVLTTFRSPGNGGQRFDDQRADGTVRDTQLSQTPGGAARQPVSTIGQLAIVDEPIDAVFNGRLLDTISQTVLFSDALRVGADSGDFVDVGGAGIIRGQLVWSDFSDLDLHLILPGNGGEVFFANRTVTFNDGGAIARLDADNLGGVINVQPNLRVENIVVNGSRVPTGDYSFFVRGFTVADQSSFSLTVTGDAGATSRTVEGSLRDNENSSIVTVTFPPTN